MDDPDEKQLHAAPLRPLAENQQLSEFIAQLRLRVSQLKQRVAELEAHNERVRQRAKREKRRARKAGQTSKPKQLPGSDPEPNAENSGPE